MFILFIVLISHNKHYVNFRKSLKYLNKIYERDFSNIIK